MTSQHRRNRTDCRCSLRVQTVIPRYNVMDGPLRANILRTLYGSGDVSVLLIIMYVLQLLDANVRAWRCGRKLSDGLPYQWPTVAKTVVFNFIICWSIPSFLQKWCLTLAQTFICDRLYIIYAFSSYVNLPKDLWNFWWFVARAEH